ncbi:MAG: methyltransferase family protein [Candidatus Thorarchaeota archaeon]
MVEKNKRKIKRILALIISGVFVVIILPIIGVYVSLFLDSTFKFPQIVIFPINLIIAIIVMIIAFIWAIWSNFELYHSGKGSPVPLKGTQTMTIVSKGPYRYSRNPMVFGYILLWIGLGFLFNSIFLLIGFSLIITILLILIVKLWEEKDLESRFGNSYLEYKKKVSFLIPLPPKKKKKRA